MTISARDRIYVEHMLECIDRIERYVNSDRSRFMKSEMVQDAVTRNLQTLAESSQRLSDTAKNSQPEIDWRAISGFRNILVHDYLGLDLETIWLVVAQDIPQLKTSLEILRDMEVPSGSG
jgi:uncharacterized protein with HEPN domain